MDGRCTCTIKEILADPRYREFARSATDHGKQVLPDDFPWKYMGLSDAEFMARPIQLQSGEIPSDELKWDWLGVVRAQEKLVVNWWHWWPGWEALDRDRCAAQPAKPEPAAAPRMLF